MYTVHHNASSLSLYYTIVYYSILYYTNVIQSSFIKPIALCYLEVHTVEGVKAFLENHPFYGEHVPSVRGVEQLGDEDVREAVLDGLPLAPSSNLHHVVA